MLLVVADLLYEPALGVAVAHRIFEALQRGTFVIVGDSPDRPGRSHMISTLSSLMKSQVSFAEVDGLSVTGYRHDLISTSRSKAVTLKMAILKLSPEGEERFIGYR